MTQLTLPAKFYTVLRTDPRPCIITGSQMHFAADCGVPTSQADVAAMINEYGIDGDTLQIVEVNVEDGTCADVTEDLLRSICWDAWCEADTAAEMPNSLTSFWPIEATTRWGYQGVSGHEREVAA